MEKQPVVTVILTVYKRTSYLETALRSILAQTMESFEIILADDSGCQLAAPIYQLYAADERIRYQPNAKTLGIVASLKDAVAASNGQFISILNDDDCWEPEFLAKLSAPLLAQPTRVLAFSDHWVIDAQGKLDTAATDHNTQLYKRADLADGEIPSPQELVLLHNGIPLAMASIFRKDAIAWPALSLKVVGAYDFWLACLLAATGQPCYYVRERLTRYRVHAQMETGRRSLNKQLNMIYIYGSLLKQNLFPSYTAHLTKLHSFFLYRAGRDSLHFNKTLAARRYLRKAIKTELASRYLVMYALSYLPSGILKKLAL
jgi:glycosyltransferase involved in cell wall biosynthesis